LTREVDLAVLAEQGPAWPVRQQQAIEFAAFDHVVGDGNKDFHARQYGNRA
jgi:hypothetical protein